MATTRERWSPCFSRPPIHPPIPPPFPENNHGHPDPSRSTNPGRSARLRPTERRRRLARRQRRPVPVGHDLARQRERDACARRRVRRRISRPHAQAQRFQQHPVDPLRARRVDHDVSAPAAPIPVRAGRVRPHRLSLLSSGWSIRQGSPDDEAPPADAHGDAGWMPIPQLLPVAGALRALGQWSLDGPARRFDAETWWYRLSFDAPEPSGGERIVLGFDGLATLAQVWLNGREILQSRSMFVAHEVDVAALLRPDGNELLLRFGALDAELGVRRKRPRWRAPMVEHQQLRWLRTTLLGRTPGWSPPAAVVGPWKDIWLERRGLVEVGDLRLIPRVAGTTGIVSCRVGLRPLAQHRIASVQLRLEHGGAVTTVPLAGAAAGTPGPAVFEGSGEIDQVALWWPHTHGDPALYVATLEIRLQGQSEAVVVDLGRLGFRTVTLDANDGDFSLGVNGVPVFCRGACWTPLDVVTLRATPEANAAAVAQAREAGMNMLRVTGTMVYEDDAFFDACDELGMLVWQDLMFANMDYPADDEAFLASVSAEGRQQLRSIHSHASLALICGNSEVEQQAAMWGAAREAWRSPLFDTVLAELCAQHAPHVPYWPSSAHGGAFPHQASSGTTSYYGVGAYLRGIEDARRSDLRFATECLAFANVPGPPALERMPGVLGARVHHPGWKQRSPRDLGAGWDFDDVRDHYLATLFQLDPTRLRYADHDRYLALSRWTTAEVMAASFAEWRRADSRCRGALVLFLRDLWAGAGWGLGDDPGVPKACWHALNRVLQPVTVLLTDEGVNGLCVHVVNERERVIDAQIEVSAWRGGEVRVASAERALCQEAVAVGACAA